MIKYIEVHYAPMKRALMPFAYYESACRVFGADRVVKHESLGEIKGFDFVIYDELTLAGMSSAVNIPKEKASLFRNMEGSFGD